MLHLQTSEDFTRTKAKDSTFYCQDVLVLAVYHFYTACGQDQNRILEYNIIGQCLPESSYGQGSQTKFMQDEIHPL